VTERLADLSVRDRRHPSARVRCERDEKASLPRVPVQPEGRSRSSIDLRKRLLRRCPVVIDPESCHLRRAPRQ